VISSEKVGFLLDRHDENWLADKTLLLLRNPNLRQRMGTMCRNVLAERYDPVKNAVNLLRLLNLGVS